MIRFFSLLIFLMICSINRYRILDEYPSEEYCDVYWIKFATIGYARIAKRKLDNWSFFGRSLHVCYAPEFESVYETREKLAQRRKVVAQKTKGNRSIYGDFVIICSSNILYRAFM